MRNTYTLLFALTASILFIATAQDNDNGFDLLTTEDLFSAPMQPNPLTNDPEAVVLRVNNMEIKRGEIIDLVNLTMQRIGGQVPPQQIPQLQQQMYTRVKNDLINAKLIESAVKKADIPVSEADIDAEIATIRESLPEGKTLEELLAVQENTLDELKTDIRNQLASRILFEQQVEGVTEANAIDAKTFYDENPSNFQTPEQVSASHILIATTEDASEDPKATLEEIRASIIAGEISFAEAAAAHSSCPSSAKGGSLGTFGKGQMVPEFEIAAFTQEIGEVGDIVQTQFGCHIIQVSERTEEGTIAFETAKNQIIEFLTNQSKQQVISSYIENLRDQATIEELSL